MKTYNNLFSKICTYENLSLAFTKAKKRKSKKDYVIRFEKNLKAELLRLQWELLMGIYKPAPLKTFIVKDPKTRKISASHFRDRVIHHAICNVIESIFEPRFIYDSFANRKGKGTSGTLKRFDKFLRKVKNGFALKADIRKYFESVDQRILLNLLSKRIKDTQIIDLISIILKNHKTQKIDKGMPLGNLTSQFFANIYLSELDYFVKHKLRAKYYLRYVDDFVIVEKDSGQLTDYQQKIQDFLAAHLELSLHPQKTQIIKISDGVPLVGFKVYKTHKIIKRSNRLRFFKRLNGLILQGHSSDTIKLRSAGWLGYAQMGNSYKVRERVSQMLGGLNEERSS